MGIEVPLLSGEGLEKAIITCRGWKVPRRREEGQFRVPELIMLDKVFDETAFPNEQQDTKDSEAIAPDILRLNWRS